MNHNGTNGITMSTMRTYERIGMLSVADPNYIPNPQDPASSARNWMDQYRDQQAHDAPTTTEDGDVEEAVSLGVGFTL